jgi:twinkle protein
MGSPNHVVPASMGYADSSRFAADDDDMKVISVLDNAKAIALQRNLHEDEECRHVLEYLTTTRGLKPDVLSKYCVGAIAQPFYESHDKSHNTPVSKWCVTFPWMARASDLAMMGVHVGQPPSHEDATTSSSTNGKHLPPPQEDANAFNVVRLKVRAIDDKSKQKLVPKGGSWGLFGWNTVPAAASSIVITEGEFDAMAVYQATGWPAISLPNGCRSMPPAILPLLERFTSIYLWMDNDIHGAASLDKFASKLGVQRTYIVRTTAKDANDALLSSMDMKAALEKAERKPHSQITTFDQLRQYVRKIIICRTIL